MDCVFENVEYVMFVVCEGEGVDDGVELDDCDGEEYSFEEVDGSEDFGL